MYGTILVPIDGSPASINAFDCSVSIARATGATIRAMLVVEPVEYELADEDSTVRSATRRRGRETLSSVVESGAAADLTIDRDVREGVPYQEIVALAESKADLIVLGTRGLTAEAGPGSTTQRVLSTSETPVLAVPTDASLPDDGPRCVLAATDGSESASRTADHALELAANVESAVDILHVIDETNPALADPSQPMDELVRQGGHDLVERLRTAASERDLSVTTAVTRGVPGEEITSRASTVDADLIAMGTRGRATPAAQLLGGTTVRVLRQTDRPVLLSQ
ncbi:UspA domain protein (plasmid) [Natrialba magadii ATCC 43099]|uniref:UspA domain protein n=1 Tax=Natrialba magadii (strain ATCC 43099 / DSM 3394 / CCM 3739 / CIP 104546 / IAM 13178 / JCM 8861 / NBRC 102185 / NCIMB 2190 / MS3) TaxID=547559 RepID=D3T180_NATMM|nr:universal stress protein [Natrialba magadii]ADD07339.1 UspA domain protein [Natrialba magadii ATCC 43099]ELY32595.1 UspA domain-containing protein [Natrialba magadii ATCC 43099]